MAPAPLDRFDRAVAFLMSLVRDDPRPYRDRARLPRLPVCALLERIGDPQRGLRVVHIAGSKGKGSTALYLEGILQTAGMRTGVFTSPHLQRWTERIRIDGRESSPEIFANAVLALEPHVRALEDVDPDTAPSFFDVLTAAAFLVFAERSVDCAIVEAGIGGRLDATNVVAPALTCITSIEREHTDKLGESLAAIAGEKAGIVKAGAPLVTGTLPVDAEAVVQERAAALGVERIPVDGEALVPGGGSAARNAALAVACAGRLAGGAGVTASAVEELLARIRPPGRLEILRERPWIVVDGAHTRASTRALAQMLRTLPATRVHLVISLGAARDADEVLEPLLAIAHRVVTTRAEPTRCMDGRVLADRIVAAGLPRSRVSAVPDPRAAIAAGRDALAETDLLCVAGSMYLAGVAREALSGERTDAA